MVKLVFVDENCLVSKIKFYIWNTCMNNGLWLLSEEDFSWNCYTGTLSFDGRYNSCKRGYHYLGRSFHWLSLNYKVPRQLSYGVVVPELYGKKNKLIMTQQGRLLDGIAILISYWFMPNQTTEMNYACVKSYWFKLLLQIIGFQGHG